MSARPFVTKVPSTSTPGREYVVRRVGDSYECQCPGFTYRRSCRHVKALAFDEGASQAGMAWVAS